MVIGVLAPIAGVGLLYLLRQGHVAAAGPAMSGALPLEQLARADAQPLLRMALAWLPIGAAAGGLVAAFTGSWRPLATAILTLVAGVVLVLSGGLSDALANNLPLTSHLSEPLHAAGMWVSLVLFVIGAGAAEALAGAALRAPSAA